MAKTFKVEISDLSDKILRWGECDPQKWFEIVVKNRANAAIEELYALELRKAIKNKTNISGDKKKVVLESTELNAKERHLKVSNELPSTSI